MSFQFCVKKGGTKKGCLIITFHHQDEYHELTRIVQNSSVKAVAPCCSGYKWMQWSGARDEGEGACAADHEGEREHQGEHGPRVEEPRVH